MIQKTRDQLYLHESSKPLLEQLQRLFEFSEREMRGRTFLTKDDLRLIILLQIAGATSRIIHSVLAQIKGESFYGLDFLLRPLVEGLINYKYIKEDPTQMRARAFNADDIKSRLANIRRLIALTKSDVQEGRGDYKNAGQYRDLEVQLVQEQKTLIDQFGKENLKFPSLEKRAEESGSMGVYSTVYWLLCQDTHLTSRGLNRFMSESEGILNVSFNQDLDRFNKHLKTFYIIFVTLLSECSEEFGIPRKEELAKFASI